MKKRGNAQFKNSVHPYQRFRYFSGVPFRHGPSEAVKYCLNSRHDNPAPRLEHERNMLRDELVRHVETDKRMSEFDFGIQFLDSDAMRDGRKQRDDIYLGRELERRMAGAAGAVPHRRAARAGPRLGLVG